MLAEEYSQVRAMQREYDNVDKMDSTIRQRVSQDFTALKVLSMYTAVTTI